MELFLISMKHETFDLILKPVNRRRLNHMMKFLNFHGNMRVKFSYTISSLHYVLKSHHVVEIASARSCDMRDGNGNDYMLAKSDLVWSRAYLTYDVGRSSREETVKKLRDFFFFIAHMMLARWWFDIQIQCSTCKEFCVDEHSPLYHDLLPRSSCHALKNEIF